MKRLFLGLALLTFASCKGPDMTAHAMAIEQMNAAFMNQTMALDHLVNDPLNKMHPDIQEFYRSGSQKNRLAFIALKEAAKKALTEMNVDWVFVDAQITKIVGAFADKETGQ